MENPTTCNIKIEPPYNIYLYQNMVYVINIRSWEYTYTYDITSNSEYYINFKMFKSYEEYPTEIDFLNIVYLNKPLFSTNNMEFLIEYINTKLFDHPTLQKAFNRIQEQVITIL